MTDDHRSYHGQPVIKEPIWAWEIPCYFFAGGLGGASAAIACLCDLTGDRRRGRRTWATALAALSVSPALLTMDLGKPVRFVNMLRVFKVTSPMSVGSWILTGSGLTTAIATLNAWTGLFERAAAVARPASAVLGMPLSTYTAALTANTAVPIWHEARGTLSAVFAGGAAASAGAAGVIIAPEDARGPVGRVALGGALAELAATRAMEQRLGPLAEPYHEGLPGRLAKGAQLLTAAGAAGIAVGGRRRSRGIARAGAVLLVTGAFAERWGIFKAGFKSASDPKYVVGPQRDAIERGERRGAARREARARVAATA